MKKMISGLTLSAILLGGATIGCDRTVEKKETTEVNRDGSTETKTEKTTVDNDGTVTKEKETKETPPTNP